MQELKYCRVFDNCQHDLKIVRACVFFKNEAYLVDQSDNVYYVVNNLVRKVDVLCNKIVIDFAYAYCKVNDQSSYHMLALTKQGHIYAWGQNSFNQTFNSTESEIYEPQKIVLWSIIKKHCYNSKIEHQKFSMIACGSAHSVAITDRNSIISWGNNKFGQIGNGQKNASVNPYEIYVPHLIVPVKRKPPSKWLLLFGFIPLIFVILSITNYDLLILIGAIITFIAFFISWCLCMAKSQTIEVKLPICDHVINDCGLIKSVSCGAFHNLVLLDNGTVWGWGSNSCGQLGKISSACILRPVPLFNNVEMIAAVNHHSLILSKNRVLYTMGNNTHGQCGNFGQYEYAEPIKIELDFVAIATINGISLARNSHGQIYAWGLYKFEELREKKFKNDAEKNEQDNNDSSTSKENEKDAENSKQDNNKIVKIKGTIEKAIKAYIIPEPILVNCRSFNEFVSRYSSLTYFTVQTELANNSSLNQTEILVQETEQGKENPIFSTEESHLNDMEHSFEPNQENFDDQELIDESKLLVIEYELDGKDSNRSSSNHTIHNEFALFSKCCVSPGGDLTVQDVKQTGEDNSSNVKASK